MAGEGHDENGVTIETLKSLGVCCPRTAWNRIAAGTYHSWRGEDGKRYVDRRDIPSWAQEKLLKDELDAASEEKPAGEWQLTPFEPMPIERELKGLNVPQELLPVVGKVLEAVRQIENCNYRTLGKKKKGEFGKALANGLGFSYRTLQRRAEKFRETGDFLSLVPAVRGPKPSRFPSLTADATDHLDACYLQRLRFSRAFESLTAYLKGKQISAGIGSSRSYHFPTWWEAYRYWQWRSKNSISKGARGGPEKMRAACGYIRRSWRDLKSLSRVCVDEWMCDFFAYDSRNPETVRRWWLLTFYDARSRYPLVGKLVRGAEYDVRHGIRESDEIEILATLLREFGAPEEIYSDHGRFRGRTFGGHARKREKFDGILDRFGIAKIEPRKKNPRGSPLERFHLFLAQRCAGVPGWIGASDKEREGTPGDAQALLHERWRRGDPEVRSTPLLSNIEAEKMIEGWMEKWRDHPSEGTDMDGLSPRAVFVHNTPEGGFRRISEEEIELHTAERFTDKKVQSGGIIKLRDGAEYYHPALLLIQGQKREVVRSRADHSRVRVHPASKGDDVIEAPRCVHVGARDPEALARAMELKNRISKIAGRYVAPREMNTELSLPASDAVRLPAQMQESAPGLSMLPERTVEEKTTNGVKPLDFADLEV
jgi:hypothetical protein